MIRFVAGTLVLLAAFVIACGGDSESPGASTSVIPANDTPTSGPPAEEETPPPDGATTPQETPAAVTGLPSSIQLEGVFPDLSFARMTGLYQIPSGSWLVTEKIGRVMLVDRAGTQASVLLDLTDRVSTDGNEEGLLGLALAPDFVDTGIFFVYYSAADPRRSVVSRFDSDGNENVVLEVPQPFSNHNGGQIVFGPDGYLYIGLGDGGSARDPQGNGQNLGTLLGSLLRIDVSGSEAGYAVPPDNPFVGVAGARGEIWAYGLRNPWRFSFDKATGDLWVGDVGQNTREEIDFVVKGGNYGWNIMEGFDCLGGGSNCDQDGLLLPVIDYENGDGDCSVTGGFVYRGSAIPALQGAFVYADYCSGKIWALRYDGSEVTEHEQIARADFRVSSFAQDNEGELYALDHGDSGGVYRLVP
jgi:glucose/arabinose dehydrogenase